MGPVLVKLMTIRLHYKSILIPQQQILWTCFIFLSSINNTFFSVLVFIFSNMSYFCFNYTNTFFIHTMNYFSVVLRIIFQMCIENYFFIGPRIIFAVSRIYFWAYNALRALHLKSCCVFLSSLNNSFFSVLVIIFSNKSYFCFNYRNTFLIHAMNYFQWYFELFF